MRLKDWLVLAWCVALSQAAGLIGSAFTVPAISGWYATLTRPALAPPNWIFGPVWTTLFFLMGVAAFLVWRHGAKGNTALTIFAVQLVLNVLWSALFFGLQSPGAGLIGIALLWTALVATIIAFAKVSKLAAWLLVPYIAWVSFAAFLNYQFWILN